MTEFDMRQQGADAQDIRPVLRCCERYCELVAFEVADRTMIVCNCNAIREGQVREAARAGCADPLSAYASLGRRPRCGQCVPYARQIIAEERAAA